MASGLWLHDFVGVDETVIAALVEVSIGVIPASTVATCSVATSPLAIKHLPVLIHRRGTPSVLSSRRLNDGACMVLLSLVAKGKHTLGRVLWSGNREAG